jgi:hypothetical protein
LIATVVLGFPAERPASGGRSSRSEAFRIWCGLPTGEAITSPERIE